MPKVRPGNTPRYQLARTSKKRYDLDNDGYVNHHLYGIRPRDAYTNTRVGVRCRGRYNLYSRFLKSNPVRFEIWQSPAYKESKEISNTFMDVEHNRINRNQTVSMKIRPRVISNRSFCNARVSNRGRRRMNLNEEKHYVIEDNVTTNAMQYGVGVTSKSKGENIHHFTEEYYLPYLVRDYDFSLTHNDLLSIDKDHIPVVVNMLEEYFNKFNDPELKLRRIELIDHVAYMNKLFLFSFSKVFIIAKMNSSTNPTNCYVTEFIAFSKYPETEDIGKMISEVSNMIYKSIVARDLNTNIRLIDMSAELNKDVTFCKFVSDGKTINQHEIKIKGNLLSLSYYPYLDVQMLMDEYSKSDDKLLILYGENGSGKTKLSSILAIKLHDSNYTVVICSGADADNVNLLAELEDKIYSSANKLKHVAVIVDDLDPKYLNRNNTSSESNIFFNKLLTILDGNFDINLKFIITTNHILREEADEPLYRSGRLFDSIYIRYLTPDEAKSILKDNGLKAKEITDFLSNKKDKIKQSDLAQFIRMSKTNISRKYRLDSTGDNFKTRKVGFVK